MTSIFRISHDAYICRGHNTIARGGVSLLLRIGNPTKRERALTSAYKLLVDISSVTSLPAMCRLVSAIWWMVPPAPPISLLSSYPSRRALPQIVAHKRTQARTTALIHIHALCIHDTVYVREKANDRRSPYKSRAGATSHLFSSGIFFTRSIIFSRDI